MADDFSRLVSLACHDLRTPLATVSGFAHTLRQNEIGQPADRYVEMIQAASGQLADIRDGFAEPELTAEYLTQRGSDFA